MLEYMLEYMLVQMEVMGFRSWCLEQMEGISTERFPQRASKRTLPSDVSGMKRPVGAGKPAAA